LPQVTAWLNYRTTEDEFFVDQERIETRLQVSQSIEPFDYDYSFRRENTDDLDADVESERTEHIARLTYQDRHLDDKLSTTVSVFASERDNSTDVPAGTIPSLQVFPTLAFADVDTTPQISSLSTNAALIDANFATSTGIDIGGFGSAARSRGTSPPSCRPAKRLTASSSPPSPSCRRTSRTSSRSRSGRRTTTRSGRW
jgi:hypothetical protein